MPKTALDYERDFSEEGLRQALYQRGIPDIEAEPFPEGLQGMKSRLVYLAMQWNREKLDIANTTCAKDVASFGHKTLASKKILSEVDEPELAPAEPQLNLDDFFGKIHLIMYTHLPDP